MKSIKRQKQLAEKKLRKERQREMKTYTIKEKILYFLRCYPNQYISSDVIVDCLNIDENIDSILAHLVEENKIIKKENDTFQINLFPNK